MEKYSFNLIDQPWIPCAIGDNTVELGLKELYRQAKEIREISDNSPLVTGALYRLCLALLHRVFGPSDYMHWAEIWGNGMWDCHEMEQYLERYYSCFDLFSEKHPFFQTSGFSANKEAPLTRLYHELTSGNNPTLFDHSNDGEFKSFCAAAVARVLVAHQMFAVGGGKSSTGYTSNGPLIGGTLVLVNGDNLFETLMFNLIRYNPETNEPIVAIGEDKPVWEKEKPIKPGTKRKPDGYLDLLTWQSRAIRLIPEGDETTPSVSKLYYGQGEELVLDGQKEQDPQIPLRISETKGYVKLRVSKERALWRDSTVILSNDSQYAKSIKALEFVAALRLNNLLSRKTFGLRGIGLGTDKAKVHLWIDEQLPLPVEYLENPKMIGFLKQELERADQCAKVLRNSLYVFALYLVYPNSDSKTKLSKQQQETISKKMEGFNGQREYWSGLEYHYHSLMTDLVNDKEKARNNWIAALRFQAEEALGRTLREMDHSAKTLRASGKAEFVLYSGLMKIIGKKEGKTVAK